MHRPSPQPPQQSSGQATGPSPGEQTPSPHRRQSTGQLRASSPASPRQRPSPHWQAVPSPSSTKPSQSLSTRSHCSAAGTRAVQCPQPSPPRHTREPRQAPCSFACVHVSTPPAVAGAQHPVPAGGAQTHAGAPPPTGSRLAHMNPAGQPVADSLQRSRHRLADDPPPVPASPTQAVPRPQRSDAEHSRHTLGSSATQTDTWSGPPSRCTSRQDQPSGH